MVSFVVTPTLTLTPHFTPFSSLVSTIINHLILLPLSLLRYKGVSRFIPSLRIEKLKVYISVKMDWR